MSLLGAPEGPAGPLLGVAWKQFGTTVFGGAALASKGGENDTAANAAKAKRDMPIMANSPRLPCAIDTVTGPLGARA